MVLFSHLIYQKINFGGSKWKNWMKFIVISQPNVKSTKLN